MFTRRDLLKIAAASPVAAIATPLAAGAPPVFAPDGFALSGADPVAYFDGRGPLPGLTRHAVMWDGAVWLFASAAHREAFERDPTAFAPQYGGYCAFAVSRGTIAPTAPEAWTVHRGKLYLNYSVSVRRRWRERLAANVAMADANWPAVLEMTQ